MKKTKDIDYAEMAQGIENIREMLSAAVAGLVADGFTDREARMVLAGIMASQGSKTDES